MHINHGSMGHGYWPMTHKTHPDLLTHLAHDPWPTDPLSALTLRLLALAREFGTRLSPDVGPGHKHLKFLTQKLEKRINKHINVIKICMIFIPLFSQDTPMEWTPESEMIFIFQKVKPTWNQPDLSSVYVAACFLHLRNTSFASLLGDRRDLVGLIIRPIWLKILTVCRAAWCREELQSKRSQSCKRIVVKQMQSSWTITVMSVLYENERNWKICLNVHL